MMTGLPEDIFQELENQFRDDEDAVDVVTKLSVSIPPFEGQEVQATKVSFTSGTNLEVEDAIYRSEDIVRFVVEARVSAVNHKTDETTGNLVRIHTLKVIDVTEVPYDLDIDSILNKGQ